MRILRLVVFLSITVSAFGDITGRGAFPLSSTWLKSPSQLYRPIAAASTENAARDSWANWLFEIPGPPPDTLLQDVVGRGVIVFER